MTILQLLFVGMTMVLGLMIILCLLIELADWIEEKWIGRN